MIYLIYLICPTCRRFNPVTNYGVLAYLSLVFPTCTEIGVSDNTSVTAAGRVIVGCIDGCCHRGRRFFA